MIENDELKFIDRKRRNEGEDVGVNGVENVDEKSEYEENVHLTGNIVSHRTPVLFSTNRGLHLRTAKYWHSRSFHQATKNSYNLQFCDLERWSTNRANSVGIIDDDSFESKFDNQAQNKTRSVRFSVENDMKRSGSNSRASYSFTIAEK